MNKNRNPINIVREKIAEKAFYLYQERINRCSPGNEVEDWLKAEALVLDESTQKKISRPASSRKKAKSSK